jgi:hypothetical protein
MKYSQVERRRIHCSDDLCSLVEDLGYNNSPKQLQCNNGSYVSSLMHFFDDNPGAMEAVQEWILNNSELDDDDEEDLEGEDE